VATKPAGEMPESEAYLLLNGAIAMNSTAEKVQVEIAARFRETRERTLTLCNGLTAEDMMVQSTPEASPAKWHLAHTSWFFESFILREFAPAYRPFNSEFHWLFNSYYESFSIFPEKKLRASFSRPSLDEVLNYRQHVDAAIEKLLDSEAHPEALRRIVLGVNHEEQHQELLLTDIFHAFFTNPLRPAYAEHARNVLGASDEHTHTPLAFEPYEGGLLEFGHSGEGFCFDNELPRHRAWLEPYSLSQRLITCGEFAEFIADGGYKKPELWLSAGWDAVKANGWKAPLYWTNEDGGWSVFTLRGSRSLDEMQSSPVSHVSYYEADAYARWRGYRLPTEFEWEAAATQQKPEGNLLDTNLFATAPANERCYEGRLKQCFGDCWEWTGSAYLGYPGFHPLEGTLGEYNGKFMSGQMVLRGGSCVTPNAHIRASYRNFFAPETRWQFSGIRLAS
jgi:ergothioneine biosynthesis protein EgtB